MGCHLAVDAVRRRGGVHSRRDRGLRLLGPSATAVQVRSSIDVSVRVRLYY